MRAGLWVLVTVGLFCAGATLIGAARGQSAPGNPSSDQIVRALTPTGPIGPSRGIRPANAPAGPSGAGKPTPGQAPAAHTPSVNLNVEFAKGSAELTAQAIKTLNQLGIALNQPALAPYRFRIEGHTDTVGTADYNKQLSERRAAVVASFLQTNFKVAPDRLEAIGMGVSGLLVPTPDQTDEPRNRRVAVINLGS
jgi:OmpA-OmpF porin, OOP family